MSDTVKEQLLRGERAEKQVQSLLAIELSLRARVAELEAKLAVAEANLEVARTNAVTADEANQVLQFRVAELEDALKEIAENSHDEQACDYARQALAKGREG